MNIIGVTGTIGAGKGTVVEYLVQKKNFIHISVRDFLLEEINKRGIEPSRDSMYKVANEFRAKHGPSYIIKQLLSKARKQSKNQKIVIESIRTLGEVEDFKKEPNTFLIAIDAPQALRYQRVFKRQSSTDKISFEKFISDEARENTSNDPGVNNLQGCQKLADVIIDNSGTLEDLHRKIEEVLGDNS